MALLTDCHTWRTGGYRAPLSHPGTASIWGATQGSMVHVLSLSLPPSPGHVLSLSLPQGMSSPSPSPSLRAFPFPLPPSLRAHADCFRDPGFPHLTPPLSPPPSLSPTLTPIPKNTPNLPLATTLLDHACVLFLGLNPPCPSASATVPSPPDIPAMTPRTSYHFVWCGRHTLVSAFVRAYLGPHLGLPSARVRVRPPRPCPS